MSESSPARTILLIGLAVALSVAGIYLVTMGTDDSDDSDVGGGPPEIEGADSEEIQPPGLPAAGTRAQDPTRRRVEVVIAKVARVLPPREPNPDCDLVTRLSDASEEDGIPCTWVAGSAALRAASVFRGAQLVKFRLPGGLDHYRVTRLLPTEHGRVVLERGRMMDTSGSILDELGKPLEGARVWIAGNESTTDADGKFKIAAIPVDSGLPMIVRKEGYATVYRVLARSQYEDLASRPLSLRRGVELRVRIAAAPAASMIPAAFFVLPAGGRDSRLLEYPFFWQAIEPVRTEEGFAVFRDLPMGPKVRVLVQHPGFAPSVSEEIRLDKARVTSVVRAVPRPTLRGVVVDPGGRPVVGATVTVGEPSPLHDLDWLLPPLAYLRGAATTTTDASGEFSLPRLDDEEGRTVVTVEGPDTVRIRYSLTTSANQAMRITLHPRLPRTTDPSGEPSLLLEAVDLGDDVRLTIRDEKGVHGPYSWKTREAFSYQIAHSAVLRIETRVDGGAARSRHVFVRTETKFEVAR